MGRRLLDYRFLAITLTSLAGVTLLATSCSSKRSVALKGADPVVPAAPVAAVANPAEVRAKIQKALATNDWTEVLELTTDPRDSLLSLVRLRALYELKKYDVIATTKINDDPRYQPYDSFLRILSAIESKKWEDSLQIRLPTDLPRALRERLWMIRGDAYREKGDLQTALRVFKTFSGEFPASPFQSEILFRAADIELALKDRDAALEVYEKIYRTYPLGDAEDIARQRLLETGRYTRLDTDIHLARVQSLQKAARFKRAEKELETLRDQVKTDGERLRIELAFAQLQFAQRNYAKTEDLARFAIKKLSTKPAAAKKTASAKLRSKIKAPVKTAKLSAKALAKSSKAAAAIEDVSLPTSDVDTYEIRMRWQELYAWSLTRQNKHDEGVEEYKKILAAKEIPAGMHEVILYRLGMIAFDDQKYEESAEYLKQLRNQYPGGKFRESAHWFGAFALWLAELKTPTIGTAQKERVSSILRLLDQTLELPESKVLAPQVLYWKALVAQKFGLNVLAAATQTRLTNEYSLSFHRMLKNPDPFGFITQTTSGDYYVANELPSATRNDKTFSQELSWQRLEAFRSVGLQTWAKMELDRFVQSTKTRGVSFHLAVADRFEDVEDWSNLVRWADRNLDRPLRGLSLDDAVVRYHYPLAFRNDVVAGAKEFKVSPFLIWGVMREESRFTADVISRAGAVGLMQVMPSLADRIGYQLGDPRAQRSELSNPQQNIRYGAFHLRELIDKVTPMDIPEDFKWVVVVAAYNAGIDPVIRWLKEKDTTNLDLFIESIPYAETRFYVKRVLQTAHIYFELYGQPDRHREVARTKGLKYQIGERDVKAIRKKSADKVTEKGDPL